MAGFLSKLSTLADSAVDLRKRVTPKGALFKAAAEKESREDAAARKAEDLARREVYKREHGLCQCCGRKCERTRKDLPERAEAHHLHGKVGWLRYFTKCMILLCRDCHRRATGQVNDKIKPVPTKYFRKHNQQWIDGTKPMTWEKVV